MIKNVDMVNKNWEKVKHMWAISKMIYNMGMEKYIITTNVYLKDIGLTDRK